MRYWYTWTTRRRRVTQTFITPTYCLNNSGDQPAAQRHHWLVHRGEPGEDRTRTYYYQSAFAAAAGNLAAGANTRVQARVQQERLHATTRRRTTTRTTAPTTFMTTTKVTVYITTTNGTALVYGTEPL